MLRPLQLTSMLLAGLIALCTCFCLPSAGSNGCKLTAAACNPSSCCCCPSKGDGITTSTISHCKCCRDKGLDETPTAGNPKTEQNQRDVILALLITKDVQVEKLADEIWQPTHLLLTSVEPAAPQLRPPRVLVAA